MAPQTPGRYAYRSAGPIRQLVRWSGATGPGSWVLARTLYRLDRALFSITGGHQTFTALMAGMPTVMLTTHGARTSRKSTVPVVAVYDGEGLAVIASNYGRP